MAKVSNNESALMLFKDMNVTEAEKARILNLDPEFYDRSENAQQDVIDYLRRRGKATTQDITPRFPQIKILHAGSNAFELPKKAGEDSGDIVREFEAVVLHQNLSKAYWKESYADGGVAPDCASVNGIRPYVAKPISDSCVSCAYNQFGSGVDSSGNPSKGKACRDIKRLMLQVEGHELPVRMSVSAANIKTLDSYMNDLIDQGTPLGTVSTKFRTKEARNAAGVAYTGLELSTTRSLPIAEGMRIEKDFLLPFERVFTRGAIELSETATSQSAPAADQPDAAASEKARSVMG
jgi:hypothetical protein